MNNKKLVALAMTAMMSVSLFAGCSDNSNKENGNNSTTASTTSTEQETSKNPSASTTDNAYGLRDNTKDGTILPIVDWAEQ